MSPFLAQIELASPGRLIVLVLLPALIYLALRGRQEQPFWQKWSSTVLRCLVFAMLCIAWAVPSCRRESDRQFVVVAVDESASVASGDDDALTAMKQSIDDASGDVGVRWFTFATAPRDDSSPADTDISAAIHFAQAICPTDRVPTIVLHSDGRETDGNALASAIGSEIPISIMPAKTFVRPEFAVDAILAPAASPPHAPLELAVKLRSNERDTVRLQLLRDGTSIADTQVDVASGETTWRTSAELGSGDLTMFQARISGNKDVYSENNTASVVVARGMKQRVLLVSDEAPSARPMKQAIQAGGFDVTIRSPSEFAEPNGDVQEFSLIILNNVAAKQLTAARFANLDSYVRDGGGLIVIGGEETFGAAEYELTALEKLLPVVATQQPVEQQKSLALILVVDKSRSMLDENRLGLAKEAAKKVADVLQASDQVGVLAFGDESNWVSRLAPLSNKEEVLARIDKLQAQGLTNMYPAIERAYLALSQTDADSRHVILLTDGVPTPGDFDAVARRMAAAGITVSTVSLGKGADQTILEDISRIAGGNHYHVDDPSDLPKILERETRTAASKVTANEYAATTLRQLAGLNINDAPPLKSYVATNYKPGAQLLLTAGEGDPLLAWWPRGRGKAMVLTSDMDNWRLWPGYTAFWKRLVTYAMRDDLSDDGNLSVRQQGRRVTVTLDADASDDEPPAYITDAAATLRVSPRSGGSEMQATSYIMPQISPGRYETNFKANSGEQFQLDVTLARNNKTVMQHRRGIVIDYPEEYRLRPADEEKLKAIAAVSGGKYAPTAEEIFAPDGRAVKILVPLWQYFLIAALLLYLVDVAVRRLPGMEATASTTQAKKAA